jgi:hypothetical protein
LGERLETCCGFAVGQCHVSWSIQLCEHRSAVGHVGPCVLARHVCSAACQCPSFCNVSQGNCPCSYYAMGASPLLGVSFQFLPQHHLTLISYCSQVLGWGHGFAAVNGFNLGRFSCRGPQESLYIPGATLRAGSVNEIVIFEVDFHSSTNCTSAWGTGATGDSRVVTLVSSSSWTSESQACP